MGPRFRFSLRLNRTDFLGRGMPEGVRGQEQKWIVYNQYRIETPVPYEQATEIVGSGEIARQLGVPPDKVKLIKEAYVGEEFISPRIETGISRIYNPFVDAPEIFLEFASLGRQAEPDKSRILKFVHRYGDIATVRIDPEEADQNLVGTTSSCFLGTKVSDFHREARLAYGTLRLYEGILSLKEETTQQWVDYIVNRWDEFGLRWDEECSPEDYHECKREAEAGTDPCTQCFSIPPIENRVKTARDAFDAGSILLVDILFKKMHPDDRYSVVPVLAVQLEYRQGRSVPRFYASWLIPTLLQAIWTLFYLRVTNQIQQEYRICPFCEEPIIKPRRNQVYHEGCRQAKFNQEKREVLRLWREGKSVEEIAEVTGLELDRIAKWVRKKEGVRVTKAMVTAWVPNC